MTKYKNSSNKKSLIFLLFAGVFVFSMANLLPKIQVYINKPEAAALLTFPKDHASHPDYKAEWWYLNMYTKTTNGTNVEDLSYLLSFTRIDKNVGLLSSRYNKSNNSFNERTDRGKDLNDLVVYLQNQKYLFVQYTNGQNYATLEEKKPESSGRKIYKLTGKTTEIGTFNLTLKERKASSLPLLWGGNTGNCRGRISVFDKNDTYYYSIPNLDITGTITDVDGTIRNVKAGKAWMDHQWFSSTPPSNWIGHYWSSLHFSNSNDFYGASQHYAVGFVTQIYNDKKLGEIAKNTYWVKRNPNGSNECGQQGNISISNYGSTNYPSSWKIELKKSGSTFLEANGNSFSDNQIIKPPLVPQFFEPGSYYSGKINGKSFTGLGFFETHLTKPQ